MSSLWTPGGEHEVPREPEPAISSRVAAEAEPPASDVDEAEMAAAEAELRDQIDATRRQVAETPAVQVVANHAIGLFELAAIHLGTQPPHLPDAALAIDAFGALVEGLGGRLGESEPALRDALAQIRLAFVQVKASAG